MNEPGSRIREPTCVYLGMIEARDVEGEKVRKILFFLLVVGISGLPAIAQDTGQTKNKPASNQSESPMHDMPGMSQHPDTPAADEHKMNASMHMESQSLIETLTNHTTAGTDAEPNSTTSAMLMTTKGKWQFMFHGTAFLSEIQQSGPRGEGKLFSTNWLMPMAQRKLGNGTLTLRAMLSLEPATVSRQRYPELFQQGETA